MIIIDGDGTKQPLIHPFNSSSPHRYMRKYIVWLCLVGWDYTTNDDVLLKLMGTRTMHEEDIYRQIYLHIESKLVGRM